MRKTFWLTSLVFIFLVNAFEGRSDVYAFQDSLLAKATYKSDYPVDTLRVDEVEVNAPIYIHSIKKWPGSVNQLKSEQIKSGNAFQISEQLNTLPGVFMQQGTMSTNRITIRGIGSRTPYQSNRIKAYWGEMPLTDGDGVTSIEDLSLNDISTIQVLKGPSSALYGAGLGGVILINPWQELSNKLVNYKGELGSYGTISNQIKLNMKPSNSGQFSLGLSHVNSDGYRENSKYRRYNITLKAQKRVGRNYLHFLYNYRYLNGQIPSSIDSIDFVENPHKAASSWIAIGGYEESSRHLLNAGVSSFISSALTNSLNVFVGFNDLDELRPFNQLKEASKSLGVREKLSYRKSTFRSEVGFEWMNEFKDISTYGVRPENTGELLNRNEVSKAYINIFALLELELKDKWLIQASGNLNRTYYTADTEQGIGVKHSYDWVFSPRIGTNYQLNTLINIYASIGHGFSAPSLEEAQLPDLSFNPNIKPEQGINYELGLRFQSYSKSTQADIAFYYMDMNNLLVTKRESEAIFYGINAGETKHKGIELSINQQLLTIPKKRSIDLALTFFSSVNTFGEFEDDGVNYKGKHLPGIPEYSLAFNAHAYFKPFHILLNYKGVGDQFLEDDNSKSYEAYHKLGAKLSRDFNFQKFGGQIYFGADNLLNAHYASMVLINAPSFGNSLPRYYYPGLPFNIYGGVSVSF